MKLTIALLLSLALALPAQASGPNMVYEDLEVEAPPKVNKGVMFFIVGAIVVCALVCGGKDKVVCQKECE